MRSSAQQSKGAKSLDDFCRAFHGGASGAPAIKPYTFDDVVAGAQSGAAVRLGGVLAPARPLDRARARRSAASSAPGGSSSYDDVRSEFWKAVEEDHKVVDLTYSIGLKVKEDGTIADVRYRRTRAEGGRRAVPRS